MASTHLTFIKASRLATPELIDRLRAGEDIHLEDGDRLPVILRPVPGAFDASRKGTLDRLKKREEERGGPAVIDADFAEDMKEIIALRAPGRGDPWSW